LSTPNRYESHPLVTHPQQRLLAALDQDLAEIRIGSILGDATHIVEEFFLSVATEIGVRDFLIGQVGHQRAQIVDAVIDAAKGAGREAAVAAGLVLRGALQD